LAQIVIVTSGIASIANANLELARRLALAGHRVTYASPDPIREAVEAQGLPFVQLPGGGAHAAQPRTRGALQKALRWARGLASVRRRRREGVDALGAQEFARAVEALAPDLLVIDVELHPFIIAARARGLPVALSSNWIALNKRPGLPPLHTPIVPGRGRLGSPLGIELAWLRYRAWKRWRRLVEQARTGGVGPYAVLRQLARELGFPFEAEVDAGQWLLPFSYRALPVLCLNALELDLPHAPAPGYHYVGPMVPRERREAPGREVPAELEALLSHRDSRPLIYCAFGAFFQGDDADFFRRVIAAVAPRTDWDVVIGLGGRVDPARLGPLPPHVRAYAWVPQLRALERAACAVVHGGISTINECVRLGVPMVAYPFKGVTDQEGNGARVAFHGLGLVGDRDADDAATIRGRIERVLADPQFAAAVSAMRQHVLRYEAEGRAEAVVAALLATAHNPSEARRG
jgi:UDP:flavonoid glycosyltransferase YjiC (YdhE family)